MVELGICLSRECRAVPSRVSMPFDSACSPGLDSGITHTLQIFQSDSLHHLLAMGEIGHKVAAQSGRDDSDLVVGHLPPGNRPHMGNKSRAPLKDERQVPKDQGGDGERADCDCRLSPLETPAAYLKEN